MPLKRKAAAKRLTVTLAIIAGVLCPIWPRVTTANTPDPQSQFKLLPDQIGGFKATAPAIGVIDNTLPQIFRGHIQRTYASETGSRYEVSLASTESDSQAFAMLTHAKMMIASAPLRLNDIGTASFTTSQNIFFFKGTTFVELGEIEKASLDDLKTLAHQFAQTLDAGEGEIPVLVKHLPDWQTATQQSVYCVSLDCLQEAVHLLGDGPSGLDINKEASRPFMPQPQPVLGALDFEGGTEAVVATYGQSQLVIVEFTTPQFSVDNDSRIWTKIAELKGQGQPTPSAYRRVGNYSVFVFNSPDYKTANALIDQVKYEQVVQWLGDDPHLAERLQRYFTQTSAGVLVAVLKSSGLSLLLCLAAGALIGTMLFRHRRAQRAASYSDAGGSIRLNLDELTGPENTHRLLKSGSSSNQTSSNS